MTGDFHTRWFAIGLGLSICLLALLLWHVDLRQLGQIFLQVNGYMIAVPAFIALTTLPLRPWRWQMIFLPQIRPKWLSCFGVLSVGNLANNLLPGRGGDLLRCFLMSGKHSVRGATMVLGTLALEKVLDGLALLSVLLLSIYFFDPPQWFWQLAILSSAIFGIAVVLLALLRYRAGWLLKQIRALSQRVHLESLGEKVAVLFEHFADGLTAISSPVQMTALVLLTIAIWAAEAALIWGLALTLGISLSLAAAAFVSASLGLGLMVPAGPAFIGTYEFFCVAALGLFGVRAESALALAVLMHAWMILATTIYGFVGLNVIGMKFSHLYDRQTYTLAHRGSV